MATESKKENTKRSAHFYVKTMERTIEHGAEYVARREGERGSWEGERKERKERAVSWVREETERGRGRGGR